MTIIGDTDARTEIAEGTAMVREAFCQMQRILEGMTSSATPTTRPPAKRDADVPKAQVKAKKRAKHPVTEAPEAQVASAEAESEAPVRGKKRRSAEATK